MTYDSPPDPHGRLLTGAEAARLTGRAEATIRDWVRKGILVPYGPPGPNGEYYYLEAHVLIAERGTRQRTIRLKGDKGK